MVQKKNAFRPQRALLSVSNKEGIIELAQQLSKHQVEIVATGQTAQLLRDAQITVVDVSALTGFPELFEGRVKTLHPAIHAGLLARGKKDFETLNQHQLKSFDIVVVNLYPFEQTVSHPNCQFSQAIENIDIGGPTMIRAAAKNHEYVLTLVSNKDYAQLIEYLDQQELPESWPFELAKKAFAHTAAYDAAIANYFGTLDENKTPSGFPDTLTFQFTKQVDLRYGENPHQQSAFYFEKNAPSTSLAKAQLIQGKELSYNNLLDADAAYDCVKSFSSQYHCSVIVKHGNPCGIALANTQMEAYQNAFRADPQSSFGGIIAFNKKLELETVQLILSQQFVEVIIAPLISEEAHAHLQNKPNVRLLLTGVWQEGERFELDLRRIDGGLLVQERDSFSSRFEHFKVVSKRQPTEEEQHHLLFAWTAVKHVKSNAIVIAKENITIGIGAGQTSRVMSTRIAVWQAEQSGFNAMGAVLASDAFFPFADCIELAAQAGITAIIQPGGSIRDKEVIAAANQAQLAMIFTGMRHFKH